MIVRARWTVGGGHTHVRVFASMHGEASLAKAGDLVFRNEEWAEIGPALKRAGWELVEDTPQKQKIQGSPHEFDLSGNVYGGVKR